MFSMTISLTYLSLRILGPRPRSRWLLLENIVITLVPHLSSNFDILLHTKFGYDSTSNKFAFQRDRIKVKVAMTILEKLCHHSSAFIFRPILILCHTNV